MHIMVDDNLEKQFRRAVGSRKGAYKGAITEAMQEAMMLWMIDKPTPNENP